MEKSQQKRACRFPVAVAATPDATSTAAAIATAIGMSLYYLSRPKVGLRVVKKSLFPSGFFLSPLAQERIFLSVFFCCTVSRFRLPQNLCQDMREERSASPWASYLNSLFSSLVDLPSYTFQSSQIVALYILFRSFSWNRWKRYDSVQLLCVNQNWNLPT